MNESKIKIFFIILYIYLYIGIISTVSPALKGYSGYLLFCCDLGLIGLGLMFINKPKNRFILGLFLFFIVTSTFTYAVNFNANLLSHINGLREYFILFSAYSFINVVFLSDCRELFLKKLYGFIKPFLIIQIPVTFYQFSKYGAGDSVGGTFGHGETGVLTIVIFTLCFYLVWVHTNRRTSDRFNFRINLIILPFLLPIFINETKISFIFLALFFLFQLNLRGKALVSNIILLIFAIAILNIYNNYNAAGVRSESVFNKEFLKEYLAMEFEGKDEYNKKEFLEKYSLEKGEYIDIPRLTKITLAIKTLSQDSLKMLLGNGIGIFKGGKILGRSEYSVENLWLLGGSRPYLFFLLIQGGLINTLLILILLFYALIRNYKKRVSQNGKSRLLKNLRYFLLAILIVILFYDDSLRNGAVVIIITSISMLIYNLKTNGNISHKNIP